MNAEALIDGRNDMCLNQNLITQEDLSLIWYVASPDDGSATFDFTSGSIYGDHLSQDK